MSLILLDRSSFYKWFKVIVVRWRYDVVSVWTGLLFTREPRVFTWIPVTVFLVGGVVLVVKSGAIELFNGGRTRRHGWIDSVVR